MMRALSILCLVGFLPAGAGADDPWSASPAHPALSAPSTPGPEEIASTAELAAQIWLRFYQNWIGVVSRSKCRMEPSCSHYSLQAIRKHGAGIGIVMTADRLLHEADEQKLSRVVRTAGQAFCPDPVSNNDFWWYKK